MNKIVYFPGHVRLRLRLRLSGLNELNGGALRSDCPPSTGCIHTVCLPCHHGVDVSFFFWSVSQHRPKMKCVWSKGSEWISPVYIARVHVHTEKLDTILLANLTDF